MKFIRIPFPDSVFSDHMHQNSFMEDQNLTIPATGMFLNPVFDVSSDAGADSTSRD